MNQGPAQMLTWVIKLTRRDFKRFGEKAGDGMEGTGEDELDPTQSTSNTGLLVLAGKAREGIKVRMGHSQRHHLPS